MPTALSVAEPVEPLRDKHDMHRLLRVAVELAECALGDLLSADASSTVSTIRAWGARLRVSGELEEVSMSIV
jgi:hypothetical protein